MRFVCVSLQGIFSQLRCSKIPRPLRGAMQTRNKNRRSSKLDAYFYFLFAEREGFEPPVPLSTTVFKTAAIDHSAISPEEWCKDTANF